MNLRSLMYLPLFLCLISFSSCLLAKNLEASTITLTASYMNDYFSKTFGANDTLVTKNYTGGSSIEFIIDPIYEYYGSLKVGIGDGYPLGMGSDMTSYTSYSMVFQNTGDTDIQLSLYMNTGFTGGAGRDWTYDTFWGGPWISLSPGASGTATLDFSNAETWGAEDDPNGAWQYANGTWNSIFRLDEVTNIGFQMLVSLQDDLTISQTSLTSITASPVPIPSAVLLLGSGFLTLVGVRRRGNMKRKPM